VNRVVVVVRRAARWLGLDEGTIHGHAIVAVAVATILWMRLNTARTQPSYASD
jgi:hypothetical protein